MSRDIVDRLQIFAQDLAVLRDEDLDFSAPAISVHRIALNMAQVQRYSPPPNPAKITDSRASEYIKRFGDESWELDALDPATIDDLISNKIREVLDEEAWQLALTEEREAKRRLAEIARTM